MENELVTKTVDLMKQTNRVKAMIDLCREEMVTTKNQSQYFYAAIN